jgi:hypothetical protein
MLRSSLYSSISEQIITIACEHAAKIERYAHPSSQQEELIASLSLALNRLADTVQFAPEDASKSQYSQAVQDCKCVEAFLELMDQKMDSQFQNTPIGKVITDARNWCCKVEKSRTIVNRDEIWEKLTPCTPDHIKALSEGIFEAVWAAPIPWMDVEILKRTEGVRVLGDVYEPKMLPGGMAVRFLVIER